MAAIPMSGIDAVVFDLFGTLVYGFSRADWEGWLETSAAILEADVDAFRAAWQATGIERQTGRLGDLEENLRTVGRPGARPGGDGSGSCRASAPRRSSRGCAPTAIGSR